MNTITKRTNDEVRHTASTATSGRMRTYRRIVSVAAIVSAAIVGAFATATAVSADSWVYYDQDQVNQPLSFGSKEALRMTGAVDWHYLQSNSNNRYIGVSVKAYQSTNFQPYCIGVQMQVFRQSVQTTVGGQVTGGWSMTGPSVNVGASWSQTTSSGYSSDGMFWRCPVGGRYVPGGTTFTWRENFHPQFGTVTHVGFVACMASAPNSPTRWCTNWDVNAFGGK